MKTSRKERNFLFGEKEHHETKAGQRSTNWVHEKKGYADLKGRKGAFLPGRGKEGAIGMNKGKGCAVDTHSSIN